MLQFRCCADRDCCAAMDPEIQEDLSLHKGWFPTPVCNDKEEYVSFSGI